MRPTTSRSGSSAIATTPKTSFRRLICARSNSSAAIGGNARAWLLKIVADTGYSFLQTNRPADLGVEFDETLHMPDAVQPDAEASLLQAADSRTLREALERLPVHFREMLILRELEGMSTKRSLRPPEVPIGTVMSGLARARAQLKKDLLREKEREEHRGV